MEILSFTHLSNEFALNSKLNHLNLRLLTVPSESPLVLDIVEARRKRDFAMQAGRGDVASFQTWSTHYT